MNWSCCGSPAERLYQRRMLSTMLLYVGVVIAAAGVVRHGHPHGVWLYVAALAPAVPIFAVFGYMGLYLRDEKDEYVRLMNIWSLLAGTAALMATIVTSDFLRSFTPVGELPPFVCFMVFFFSYGIAQVVLKLRNRVSDDEPIA